MGTVPPFVGEGSLGAASSMQVTITGGRVLNGQSFFPTR
jgi:hypothetical protein